MIRKTIMTMLALATAIIFVGMVVGAVWPFYHGSVSGTRYTGLFLGNLECGVVIKDHEMASNAQGSYFLSQTYEDKGFEPRGFELVWRKPGRFALCTPVDKWRTTRINIPLWAPLLVFGFLPVISMIRGPLRRHRRRKRNQCIHCGYNLMGLPEPRCPECGASVD